MVPGRACSMPALGSASVSDTRSHNTDFTAETSPVSMLRAISTLKPLCTSVAAVIRSFCWMCRRGCMPSLIRSSEISSMGGL